jgi:very-short-patch-repair endonuclease
LRSNGGGVGCGMIHGSKDVQQRARRLRRAMSLPEVMLWRALRERPAGLRFRRQHPAGPYVLDFFCPAQKLAIEVDGEAHNRGDAPARDARRDAWLGEQGVRVMRVAASDILTELDTVVRSIIAGAASASRYPSTACGGPPPLPRGEDEREAAADEVLPPQKTAWSPRSIEAVPSIRRA